MLEIMRKFIALTAAVLVGGFGMVACTFVSADEMDRYDLDRPTDDASLYIDVSADTGKYGPMTVEELAAEFPVEGAVETDFGSMPYRLFAPEREAGVSYPLVVVLHGSGGRGDDNTKSFGDPQILLKRLLFQQEQYPCYILVPQCPAGGDQPRWEDVNDKLVEFVKSFAADVENQVEADNLIAIGISMGGYGVWDLATTFSGVFRTVVPIAGGGNIKEVLKLGEAGTRLWAFHQTEDPTCPVAGERTGVPNWTITKRAGQGPYGTRTLVQTLRDAGYSANYYEYNLSGHAWKLASSEKELIGWLFEKTKARSEYVVAGENEIRTPAPYYTDGEDVLMLPLRAVCEALGFTVEWDGGTKTVSIDGGRASLTIGDVKYQSGQAAPFTLNVAPVLVNDSTTYVPEGFFSEIMQLEISHKDNYLTINAPTATQ